MADTETLDGNSRAVYDYLRNCNDGVVTEEMMALRTPSAPMSLWITSFDAYAEIEGAVVHPATISLSENKIIVCVECPKINKPQLYEFSTNHCIAGVGVSVENPPRNMNQNFFFKMGYKVEGMWELEKYEESYVEVLNSDPDHFDLYLLFSLK